MAIKNHEFWRQWNNGNFELALDCLVQEEEKSSTLDNFFSSQPSHLQQSTMVMGISVAEFLYDLIMINPQVVKGLDFARQEDLSHLFSLSQFAREVDTTVNTGDMAQLQGYVAEQMVAAELQAKGHDVEFPETSNNAGWDLLVDGQPFQVKNLGDPAGVREHLATYPDIPVYVNEELAPAFIDHPNVYVTSVHHQDVLDATKDTILHAEDLLDFEIPWIAAGVSSFFNIKHVWKNDLEIERAVMKVASDTSSRVVLGVLGEKAGIIAGTLLFGPAGGIAGGLFGTFGGVMQGGKLSFHVKRLFSKTQEKELKRAIQELITVVDEKINEKKGIKQRKFDRVKISMEKTSVNDALLKRLEVALHEELTYLSNKQVQLQTYLRDFDASISKIASHFPQLMKIVVKTGVHPYHYQQQITDLQRKLKKYFVSVDAR